MDSILQFDEAESQRIVRLYSTPDVIGQRQQTLDLLQLQPGERVLDVGVGPGLLAQEMAQVVGNGGEVQGIDISDSMLAIARQHCADFLNVRVRRSDAHTLPFQDDKFDVAVATQVYEYVPDIDRALGELFRVLKPGGRVLILDTDWDSSVWHTTDRERMHRIIDAWNTHCPHPFLARTLAQRLTNAGFEVGTQTAIPIINPTYDQDTYSFLAINLIADYVERKTNISPEEINAWVDELHMLGKAGQYFFSINRYVVIAHKPAI